MFFRFRTRNVRNCGKALFSLASKSQTPLSFSSEDPEFQRYLNHAWTGEIGADMPILTDDYAPVEQLLLDAVASLERRRSRY